jgi:hypothetical protein
MSEASFSEKFPVLSRRWIDERDIPIKEATFLIPALLTISETRFLTLSSTGDFL